MKIRDIIFWIHLLTGITVGSVILIMATTGSMLAFRAQIINFAEHKSYKVILQEPEQQSLGVQEILAKIRPSYPEAKVTGITIKSDFKAPMIVNLGREALYVNPYTGYVLGQGSAVRHFLEKVEVWHRWLGLEGALKPLGHNIKGVCNILFLIMILTGIYLWVPWRIFRFKTSLKGKARDWNWHNVIGIWCAPFLIVITLTGLIMSYQWANDLLYRISGNEPPVKMSERGESKKNNPSVNFALLIEQAKRQVPNWTVISVRLPKSDAPVNVGIEDDESGYKHLRSQLTLNAATAEIIKWEPYSKQNLGWQWRRWARYLHTGEAGGLVGQTIAFLAALGAVMLVWTGFAMAWYRFFKK